MAVYRAIIDHLKYNRITLEHLIDIESKPQYGEFLEVFISRQNE